MTLTYLGRVTVALVTLSSAVGHSLPLANCISAYSSSTQSWGGIIGLFKENGSTTQALLVVPSAVSRQEAAWGMLVGDALAMPVHWYYSAADIKSGYGGWLTGYRAPEQQHPSSILTISATDGSGRKGWHTKSRQVVGDVILHDKLKYWTCGKRGTHYHQGMSAGDNTLNALTALETFKVLQSEDPDGSKPAETMRAKVIENYVKFMTTPGSHNDTYAESFHRLFFKDWIALDEPPKDGPALLDFCEKRFERAEMAGEDSQMAQIGALPLAVPWVLHYCHLSEEECAANTVAAIKMTHPATSLMSYVDKYARILHAVVNGQELRQVVLNQLGTSTLGGTRKRDTIEKLVQDAERYEATSEERLKVNQGAVGMLGLACYIDGSLPSMLFLATQYHNDFDNGVLTNANCGGENAHRGAALGALLGANTVNNGKVIVNKWKDGLNSAKSQIQKIVSSRI